MRERRGTPLGRVIERVSGAIAVLGGLLSLVSPAGRARCWAVAVPLAHRRDFDCADGAAIAVSRSCPTPARRGNIVVDTFTSWLPARTNAAIDAFWDVVYAGTAVLLRSACDRRHRHYAAGRPPCCCNHLRRRSPFARARAALTMVALTTAARLIRDADERTCGRGAGFGVMLFSSPCACRSAFLLVVGAVGYIHLSTGRHSSPTEDQPLSPVRQLHALRHSLFILMGLWPNAPAYRPTCFAPPKCSPGGCAAGWRWP